MNRRARKMKSSSTLGRMRRSYVSLAVTEQQKYLIALLCSSPVQCNEQEIMILGDKDPPLLLISTFSLY